MKQYGAPGAGAEVTGPELTRRIRGVVVPVDRPGRKASAGPWAPYGSPAT